MTDIVQGAAAAPDRSVSERLRGWAGAIGEVAKAAGAVFLITFMVVAVAKPTAAHAVLDALKITNVEIMGVKIQLAQTTAQAADDAVLAVQSVQEAKRLLSSGRMSEANSLLDQASSHLAQQSLHFAGTAVVLDGGQGRDGTSAILQAIPVTSGWIHVGYFNDSGQPARLADSIAAPALKVRTRNGGAPVIESVVLSSTTYVVSDGDNCSVPEVSKFDLAAVQPPTAILKPGLQPLHVIQTAACPAVGKGYDVWIKVDAPAERILVNRYVAAKA